MAGMAIVGRSDNLRDWPTFSIADSDLAHAATARFRRESPFGKKADTISSSPSLVRAS